MPIDQPHITSMGLGRITQIPGDGVRLVCRVLSGFVFKTHWVMGWRAAGSIELRVSFLETRPQLPASTECQRHTAKQLGKRQRLPGCQRFTHIVPYLHFELSTRQRGDADGPVWRGVHQLK